MKTAVYVHLWVFYQYKCSLYSLVFHHYKNERKNMNIDPAIQNRKTLKQLYLLGIEKETKLVNI